ncbi:Carboxymethylenebutenolidase [mine drainage metagenome]|uniref:Carboxymethylenebutenolidase n=2 Tax=mine drainage metagenome TaxID=410659 RepID=T0YN96_9ZZZZ
MNGYLAEPEEKGPYPALLVVHEIFGLDDHPKDVARRFAAQGYVALAPNLFTGPIAETMTPANVQLAMRALAGAPSDLRSNPAKFREFAESQPPERRPVLEALAQVTDPVTQDGFARDLIACREFLQSLPSVNPQRIGAVGFCFGGAVVGRYATVDPTLTAGVIFYGQNPPLDRVPQIRAQLLGQYAGEDPGITQTVPQLAEAMERAGRSFRYQVYPGARHAFFNDTRPNYHAESAALAWNRVIEFFRSTLG